MFAKSHQKVEWKHLSTNQQCNVFAWEVRIFQGISVSCKYRSTDCFWVHYRDLDYHLLMYAMSRDRISSYGTVHLAGNVLCGDQSCRHLQGANLWIRRGDRKEFPLSELPHRKKKEHFYNYTVKLGLSSLCLSKIWCSFCILLCLKACKLAKVFHVLSFLFWFWPWKLQPHFLLFVLEWAGKISQSLENVLFQRSSDESFFL